MGRMEIPPGLCALILAASYSNLQKLLGVRTQSQLLYSVISNTKVLLIVG
jgi:hypothetical protein